ncbi:MAG: DUF5119 domain-containing protein [Rikenellaceae bacterium]|nr:DUF5119 domain-containing protein [Rikenellaceae bacterium]
MKWGYTSTLLLAVAAQLLLAGCERRPLVVREFETALIPVSIDWSKSGVPIDEMHRATVMLFPRDGSAPLEYLMEGNLTYRTIEVPVGVYSVLVFNETTSEGDWNGISFINTDNFDDFAAIGRSTISRGFYAYSAALPLTENPEPLAAWALERFEVTKDMLVRSRSKSRAELDDEIVDLTHVVPSSRTEQMVVTARVTNLASSMQATGTINNLASGVYMASGEKIYSSLAAHAFVLNGRVYDADGKSGTTTKTFNIFGHHPSEATIKPMNIDFILIDGTAHPTEVFDDVHPLITRDEEALPPLNTVKIGHMALGGGEDDPDHPIVLPDMDMASSVSVDDWDEILIPL